MNVSPSLSIFQVDRKEIDEKTCKITDHYDDLTRSVEQIFHYVPMAFVPFISLLFFHSAEEMTAMVQFVLKALGQKRNKDVRVY